MTLWLSVLVCTGGWVGTCASPCKSLCLCSHRHLAKLPAPGVCVLNDVLSRTSLCTGVSFSTLTLMSVPA